MDGFSFRVTLANVYIKTGDPQIGEDLLRESFDFLMMLRDQGLGTPGSYYVEAQIYALQGNKQAALISLRKAIDIGWREHWYMLRNPNLESLRDTPEFKEMMAEVEADIARQREQLKAEGLL